MPSYIFYDPNEDKELVIEMPISSYDGFLAENPNLHPRISGAPLIHSGRGLGGGLRIDDGFNDVLKEIKKKHSGGYNLGRSNINTK